MGGRVIVQTEGTLGWLVFDHPERRNAISVEMWQALPGVVRELAEDESLRVILLRGAGEDAFISGADISEFGEARTGAATSRYDADSGRAFLALASLEKPVIAMIHGYCIGGGVATALAADLRYAADDAVFAVPAARLGLGYHVAGLEALMRLVGPSKAKEIFFTARRFTAAEALDCGLIDGVFPKAELESAVRELAVRIAENAPLTLRSVKLIISELAKAPEARNVGAIDASIRACFESEDYREGVQAFLQKRRPHFRGC